MGFINPARRASNSGSPDPLATGDETGVLGATERNPEFGITFPLFPPPHRDFQEIG